jgi:phosphonate transport system substrate-binding protein
MQMRMNATLEITSLMSEAADPGVTALAAALGKQFGQQVRYDLDIPDPDRFAGLLEGRFLAAWVCGIVYVRHPDLALLAAPVMGGRRYGGKAVYFSDLVVRRASRFSTLDDLRGCRFAYNERGSFSGVICVEAGMRHLGGTQGFFGAQVKSGSHIRSIDMVLAGQADTAAIDSTVIDHLAAADPSLPERLRMVTTFGPYPVPPWVASNKVHSGLQSRLRSALLEMHRTENGRVSLNLGQIARFSEVDERYYEPIREAARMAESQA